MSLQHYGVLPTRNVLGALKHSAGGTKEVVFEVSFNSLPATDAGNEALAVIPAGASIVGASLKVTTAFVGGTSYVIGCSQADGGGVVDADGLVASTATALIDAVGDYIVGGGALINATATNEALAVTMDATGTFTAGEGLLTVEYKL